MKNTKRARRAAAFAAAVVMAACAAIPMSSSFSASAADYTITINDSTADHQYEAYQIFSGTLSDSVLGNIGWGDGVDTTKIVGEKTLLQAVQAIKLTNNTEPFKDCTDAKSVANVLSEAAAAVVGENASTIDMEITKAFAAVVGDYLSATKFDAKYDTSGTAPKYAITVADSKPGYYLVKDADNSLNDKDDSYTRYILNVVDNVSVNPKGTYPEVEKKIKENVKNTGSQYTMGKYTAPTQYNDVADWNIKDVVPFELIGTMPENIGDYTGYYYKFTDTLSKGFTVDESSFEVVVHVYDENNGETKYKLDGITPNVAAVAEGTTGDYVGGKTITVAISNLKSDLTYYTWDADGSKWSDTTATGKIAIDKNTIVTVDYTATLNKDAVIGLDGNPNKVDLTYSNNPNKSGNGENDNTGKTPEETVVAFTYELDVTKYLGDKDKLADDNEGTKAGFKLSNADGSKWATVENMKISGWVDSKDEATQVETAADGTFKFIGLDDGTYVLHETKTPAGYNTMAPLELKIVASTVQCQDYMESEEHDTPDEVFTKLELKIGETTTNGTTSDGIVKTDIINQKGSSLPSTGGIGTTMFYVGGGVLVAGAGVLLITKKRAKKDAE
jgi:LPXTG-motif cell wall-anchored protein